MEKEEGGKGEEKIGERCPSILRTSPCISPQPKEGNKEKGEEENVRGNQRKVSRAYSVLPPVFSSQPKERK